MSVRDTDKGYKSIVNLFDELADGRQVLVGVRGDKGGETEEGEDATLAEIAAHNEFGAPKAGVPERSYLRSTVDENRGEYEKFISDKLGRVIDLSRGQPINPPAKVDTMLKRLGGKAVGDVKRKITALKDPPNVASTIAAKGSSNPLIEDGRLRASIDFELREL